MSGRPNAITDTAQTRARLGRLIRKFESRLPDSPYDFDKLPDDYVLGMMKGIAPFQMEIETIEGKSAPYTERSLLEVTEAFYRTAPK